MKFADIPGHEQIKQRLRNIVDTGRIPHALLLEGPEGSGKFALARALAQYIHCTNRTQDGDSCGKCAACLQHQDHLHIDTLYSFPVVKKDSRAISDDYRKEFTQFIDQVPFMDFEQWPERLDNPNTRPRIYVNEAAELMRRLSFTAHASRYKIVLMWLPERMMEDAANKLLKLVEEPFADTLFIMTSDNSREILPTIYSRVQRVKVPRYDPSMVASILASSGVDANIAAQVAQIADGNMNRAFKLAQSKDDDDRYLLWFIELMRLAYQRNIGALKAWSVKVAGEKREGLLRFLEYCCRMIRENFILNFHNEDLNRMTAPERNFSVRFAPFINERNVLKIFDQFTLAMRDVSANGNAKIITFDLAISMILLLKS